MEPRHAAGDFDRARFEMTLVGVQLLWVPLPVCQYAQREMVVQLARDDFIGGLHDELVFSSKSLPSSLFARAQAFFRMPSARINSAA